MRYYCDYSGSHITGIYWGYRMAALLEIAPKHPQRIPVDLSRGIFPLSSSRNPYPILPLQYPPTAQRQRHRWRRRWGTASICANFRIFRRCLTSGFSTVRMGTVMPVWSPISDNPRMTPICGMHRWQARSDSMMSISAFTVVRSCRPRAPAPMARNTRIASMWVRCF